MPKGKAKGKAKKAVVPEGVQCANVISDYKKCLKALGELPRTSVDVVPVMTPNEEEEETHVYEIKFEGQQFGTGGAHAFVSAMLKYGLPQVTFEGDPYSILTAARFHNCNLGDHGVEAVAVMLKQEARMPVLETLELINCEFGLAGCVALGDALTLNNKLLNLNVDSNKGIDSWGAKVLCRSVKVKKNLLNFSMSNCSVGPDACAGISAMLADKALQLTSLNLGYNNLTPDGVRILCPGLESAKTLISINLAGTGMGIMAMGIGSDIQQLSDFSSALLQKKQNFPSHKSLASFKDIEEIPDTPSKNPSAMKSLPPSMAPDVVFGYQSILDDERPPPDEEPTIYSKLYPGVCQADHLPEIVAGNACSRPPSAPHLVTNPFAITIPYNRVQARNDDTILIPPQRPSFWSDEQDQNKGFGDTMDRYTLPRRFSALQHGNTPAPVMRDTSTQKQLDAQEMMEKRKKEVKRAVEALDYAISNNTSIVNIDIQTNCMGPEVARILIATKEKRSKLGFPLSDVKCDSTLPEMEFMALWTAPKPEKKGKKKKK